MPTFEIDFKYTVEEEGCEILTAENMEDAESKAHKHIADFYPEARDVEILGVNELNG